MRYILFLLLLMVPSSLFAYDCTTISITVTAGIPNGGVAEDAVFNYTFNSNGGLAQCGQFANGDYWIAPADGETEVTFTAISTTSSGSITADADPATESRGLLDNTNEYGNYDAAEEVIAALPVTYTTNTSLVTAIQRNETVEGKCGTSAIVGECVDAYNVITILTSVPEDEGAYMLRPNVTGTTKEYITFDDMDFARLPSKSYLTGTDSAGLEAIRLRWSHSLEVFGLLNADETGYSEGGRAFRSHLLIDDYGAGVAQQFLNDLMTLFSDDNTLAEKKPALAAMMSYALSTYHAKFSDGIIRYWGTGATQSSGKFPPAAFLAAMLSDTTKATTLDGEDALKHSVIAYGPNELAQIHEGQDGLLLWGDDNDLTGIYRQGAYWGALMKGQSYDGAPGIGMTFSGPNDAGEYYAAVDYIPWTVESNAETLDKGNVGSLANNEWGYSKGYVYLGFDPGDSAVIYRSYIVGAKNGLDPYGYIDGPPPLSGTSYMITSLGPQRGLLGAMYVMPEMYNVVNSSDLENYVLRVTNDGIHTSPDPCVTPDSREDFDNCDPYRNKNCNYYGVTWGPVTPADPESECITTVTDGYTQAGRFVSIDGTAASILYPITQVEANWETIVAEFVPVETTSKETTPIIFILELLLD